MSVSITSNTQEEIDSKKRKVPDKTENSKACITSYFKVESKMPKTLALRKSTCASDAVADMIVDLNNLACAEILITYVCLMIDMLLDRDCMWRHRVAMSRLFLPMKSTDPKVVIILHEATSERSNSKNHYSCSLNID